MAITDANKTSLSANGESAMVALREGRNNVAFWSDDGGDPPTPAAWGGASVAVKYSPDGVVKMDAKDAPGGTSITLTADETITIQGSGKDFVFFELSSQSGQPKRMGVVT